MSRERRNRKGEPLALVAVRTARHRAENANHVLKVSCYRAAHAGWTFPEIGEAAGVSASTAWRWTTAIEALGTHRTRRER